MAIRKFKPTTPSLRNMAVMTSEGLTKKAPEKQLIHSIRYARPFQNKYVPI